MARYLWLLLLCWPSLVVSAQDLSVWFERGYAAYEDGRYEEAERAFRWIVDQERENAEGHYMLARVLLAQDVPEKAARSITRAIDLDPANVRYLTLQYQIGLPHEFIRPLRQTKKRELAAKILTLDEGNVTANVALGYSEAQVYLHHRNRVSVADMRPYSNVSASRGRANARRRPMLEPPKPLVSDPFDLEAQQAIGKTVRDLSDPAERAYPRAVDHLQRALATDPATREAYTYLAALYVARPKHKALLDLAQTMRKYFPQDPYTGLYLGYAAYRLGDVQQAEAHFRIARQHMPDSLTAVFEDLSRLQRPKDPDAVASNEAFWNSRDPRLLTPANERELEHQARFVYAGLLFGEPTLNLHGWDAERGQIYVRYGPPRRDFFMSNMVADCTPTTRVETDFSSITNFHVFEYGDYRFVFGNPGNYGEEVGVFSNVKIPTLNEFPLYSPCSSAMAHPDMAGRVDAFDYVMKAKATIRKEPERFDFDPAGSRVEFPYLASVFKGRDGHADVLIPFGVQVPFIPRFGRLDLGLRTGAFLLSPTDGLLDEDGRTLEALSPRHMMAFDESPLWMDVHRLSAPPGAYDVSVEFETSESAAMVGFHRERVEVPDFSDGALRLSDVLLAYRVEEAAPDAQPEPHEVLREGLVIQPAPWGVFAKLHPLYLYFESYGLTQNSGGQTQYTVEVVLVEVQKVKGLAKLIRRAFGQKQGEGVSARYDGGGDRSDEGQYLLLDVSQEPPGTYVLAVRVTDQGTGEAVQAQRRVILE